MTTTQTTNNRRRPREVIETHSDEYIGVSTINDDDPAEKPCQRVHSVLLVVVLGIFFLQAYLMQLVEDAMPSVVKENPKAGDNSDKFSEESALRYLNNMNGGEARVAGTLFHLLKTQDMMTLVEIIAAQASQPVHTDWQMISGDYFISAGVLAPHVIAYRNCSNIIALLEGESAFHSNGTLSSSILVNCHYDSVPFSQGASDNLVFCASMAEILSTLSKRQTKLKHNIIFLFNGAEENGLQGAHAFLRHPWARGVTTLINLDAAGMNGKPTVFQVTDTRLINAFKRSVPRPTAQAMAEFMFKSGLIPSDTDFRIFRDFGNMQGIDIAFAKWGHVYHTRNDRPELLAPGVVQNAGDMLLALLLDIADLSNMDGTVEPGSALYFDYLSLFLVTYSITAAYVIDVFIALLGFISVAHFIWLIGARWSAVRELLFSCLGRLLSTLAGMLVTVICIALMVATTKQMRYLSHPWLVVPLYWLPFLILAVAASQLYDAWRSRKSGLSRSLRCVQAQAATRLLMTVTTLILACIPVTTSMRYMVTVPLLIMSITSFITLTIIRFFRLKGWQHLLLEVVLSLPAMMWLSSLALRLDATMLPIMGRSSNNTPDYMVGVINILLAVLLSSVVSGIELLFSRRHLWLVLSCLGTASLVLMFIPFSPYDNDVAVQRHYWFHSEISSYDLSGALTSRSSGVLVTKQDPYTLDGVLPALKARGYNVNVLSELSALCEKYIYCDMPIYRPSFGHHYHKAMFLYTGPPAPFESPAAFTRQSKTCVGNICTFTFNMTGGAHNIITFWLYPNVKLLSWSMDSPPESPFSQLGRPVYVVYYSTATYMEVWSETFTLELYVPLLLQQVAVMDVSHSSSKLHHPEDFTTEYQAMLHSMPKHFNIASTLSFRNNYVF